MRTLKTLRPGQKGTKEMLARPSFILVILASEAASEHSTPPLPATSADRSLSASLAARASRRRPNAGRHFFHGLLSACAVMVGRAVEGACKHHGVKAKNLAGGLKELKERGLIDERIFEWGDELRKHRNLGAHASEEKIPKEDARDLLDFALAIRDYLFVLRPKFERFRERSTKRTRAVDT